MQWTAEGVTAEGTVRVIMVLSTRAEVVHRVDSVIEPLEAWLDVILILFLVGLNLNSLITVTLIEVVVGIPKQFVPCAAPAFGLCDTSVKV